MPARKGLPDRIRPGVRVLFVGINPGLRSTQTGHHFAGYSNRFWKLLNESKLVSDPLTYEEDWRLPEWQLGLTNIISRCSAGIDTLNPVEYREGVAILERKIHRYRPQIVALLGVTIFRMLFSTKARAPGRLDLGPTPCKLAGTPVFLLPNPSGRNAHYSYRETLAAFRALREAREKGRCSTKPLQLNDLPRRQHP